MEHQKLDEMNINIKKMSDGHKTWYVVSKIGPGFEVNGVAMAENFEELNSVLARVLGIFDHC